MLHVVALSLLVASPPWATRALMPVAADDPGLVEILDAGEIVVVPRQAHGDFRGLLVTRTSEPCVSLERRMMDVRGWPKIFPKIKKVDVLDARDDGRDIHYAVSVDVFLSPKLEARIKNPEPGRVTYYNDVTPSLFTWNLEQRGPTCMLLYEMYHPPGVRSDFVDLVNKVEPSINDAGEVAAALVSARGFATPEKKGARALSARGQRAFDAFSGVGTALRVIRRGKDVPVYVARRRVPVAPSVVAARIRDRSVFAKQIAFLERVDSRGEKTTWDVRSFGGSVDFDTRAEERRGADGAIVIDETVTSGDIQSGRWSWTVTPVPGGSAVELVVDLDITRGSRVLTTLARQDQLMRDSTGLQLVYEYMRLVAPEDVLPTHDPLLAGRALNTGERGAH